MRKVSMIATVILYHPEESVVDNIMTYYDLVERVIVIDNTENPNDNIIKKLGSYPKVEIILNHENFGIASPLNLAAKTALKEGAAWLLTMDQDSYFEGGNIQSLITKVADIKPDESVGVIAPSYQNHIRLGNHLSEDIIDEDTVITSGAVVNLEAYLHTNGFDEKLFIDGVDDEYCFQLKLKGYRVLRIKSVFMQHNLGANRLVRTFFIGKKTLRNLHSPFRMYYITRNYLYLIKKYQKKFPMKIAEYKKVLFNRIKNNLIYGKNRWKILGCVINGYLDYRFSKYGKKMFK